MESGSLHYVFPLPGDCRGFSFHLLLREQARQLGTRMKENRCAVIDGRTVEDSIISGPVFTVLMVSDETRKSEFPHSL